MMEHKQLEIWALELSNYFIKKHRYQLITLNQETREMWLFNPDAKLHPILMISTKPFKEVNDSDVMNHRLALAMLVKSEPKGLNFSVYPDLEGSNSQNIVVMENEVSEPTILERFKGLDQVLKKSSNLKMARSKAMGRVSKNMRRLNKINIYKSYRMTTVLSILVVIFFGFSLMFASRNKLPFDLSLLMLGAYYKPLITSANEWWRFITPMFLHADFLHLLMNLIALRNLATILEKELGSWKFLSTVLLGVVFGSAFLFIRDENVIGIGMSAGIYALFGVLLVNLYERNLYKNRMVLSNVLTTLFLNIMISTLPGVSFTAHLGGLYVGIYLGFIFSKRKDWDFLRKGSLVVLSMSIVFMGYLIYLKNIPFKPGIYEAELVNQWYRLGFERYALRLKGLLFGGSL